MRILSYEYKDLEPAKWKFSRIDLGTLNLIVGDSGSGKTRFLNTLFNLGGNVAGKRNHLLLGSWKTRLEQNGRIYRWEVRIGPSPTGGNPLVKKELLVDEASPDTPIITRSGRKFLFDGKPLPKLSRENTSIELLQDEDVIRPLYNGFGTILRRDFSKEGLRKYILYEVAPQDFLEQKVTQLEQLFRMNLGLNLKLHVLRKNFPEIYERICSRYLDMFPFVEEIDTRDVKNIRLQIEIDSLGVSPVFSIKERQIDHWIPVPELASGMQKALLILTDIYSLPAGAIYLIDEYENSLGVSVIDFLSDGLDELEKDIQVIITSHHPYVINQIPIENWIVFHRDGSEVTARYGKENIEHYGKSKQQQFIQLINDPFFNRGIE
jgi:energy-coupling factor transporter ATP-binding protein EcfA2